MNILTQIHTNIVQGLFATAAYNFELLYGAELMQILFLCNLLHKFVHIFITFVYATKFSLENTFIYFLYISKVQEHFFKYFYSYLSKYPNSKMTIPR